MKRSLEVRGEERVDGRKRKKRKIKERD